MNTEFIKHVLKGHAYQNIPLTYEEAWDLAEYALKGCGGDPLAQIQSISALCALHSRATYEWVAGKDDERIHGHALPESAAEQIAGICAAIFALDIGKSEFGFLEPDVPFAMDNCGMGGDLVTTANVSTLAAFIAAAAGVPMCKHGSPANTDRGLYGSSDFVGQVCGIDTFATRPEVEACLEMTCFAYTDACDTRYKRIHSQTHHIAKLPHMNDIIGPITNPCIPRRMTRRILGVNHLINPRLVAEAYKILNEERVTDLRCGMFVRGFADTGRRFGMDEVSICPGGTHVVMLLPDGEITERFVSAEDFGIASVSADEIAPKGDKGRFSMGILTGEVMGAARSMVLANAALLLDLADKVNNWKDGYRMAEEILADGRAHRKMLEVREMLPAKRAK